MSIPHLVGMVHLLPLPGSPRFEQSMDHVVEVACSDALALAEAGFPSLLLENYGDAPFYPDSVPPETIAAMTVAAHAVSRATGLPLGVNVLRNDPLSALAIASAVRASFIRVNVLTGLMYTDQGPIVGRAAELARQRARLAPEVEVWADVMVKHASPPPGLDADQAAGDTVERGLADALIVTGPGTGLEPDLALAAQILGAIPKGTRIVIGSGADAANLSQLTSVADTVIVGSSVKVDGHPGNRVDPARAERLVEAARRCELL